MEQLLTQLATHLRAVVENDAYLPVRASLTYSAPDHTHLYERYLGCPARFGQPMSELIYPKSILNAKPRMAHGLTWKIMRETCDRILGEVKTSTGVAGEIYQIIASTPGHSPSMDGVAKSSPQPCEPLIESFAPRVLLLLKFSTMSAAISPASTSALRS